MKPKDDQLMLLRRMRSEGRLTKAEFDELTGGRQSRRPTDEPAAQPVESEPSRHDEPDPSSVNVDTVHEENPTPLWPPVPRPELSTNYRLGIGLVSLVLVALSATNVLPWLVTVLAAGVLGTTLLSGWGKVTAVGVLVLAGTLVVSATSSLDGNQEADTTPTPTVAPAAATAPPSGSLGIYMDDVIGLWNTIEGDPQIRSGLTRQNEIGEFDTFIHRFGDGSQVAGAYGPMDEAVYALLASGPFPSAASAQLYLRLCFMTAPYSQECIEAYAEEGLAGLTLDQYVDLTHQSEWRVGDHTWRLEIGQNLIALRVYGADAA
jgi:hypothetical protein